jgi:hypothetical protein
LADCSASSTAGPRIAEVTDITNVPESIAAAAVAAEVVWFTEGNARASIAKTSRETECEAPASRSSKTPASVLSKERRCMPSREYELWLDAAVQRRRRGSHRAVDTRLIRKC